MVKTEKKKYTKKNITNKIHKSKKNSGTAKKKAFRKSKKSKKEGGLFTKTIGKNIRQSETKIIKGNVMLRKEFLILEKQPPTLINIKKMESIKEMISENNRMLRRIYNNGKSNYVDLEGVIDLSLLKIPKQSTTTSSSPSSLKETDKKKPAQLDPLPPCWKQDFKKIDGKYTTKRFYVRDDGEKSYQRPKSNEPCPNDIKEVKQEEKRKDYETEIKKIRKQMLAEEAKKAAEERARLEQIKKVAEAEAEAAKAKRLELEKAAEAAAAKKKKEEEEEAINATWSDSDATWQESYRAGK